METEPLYLPELDDTSTDHETLKFLSSLVEYLQPRVIVESGTYMGHFALLAMKYAPGALVYTADPRQYQELSVTQLAAANGLNTDKIIEYRGTFQDMLDEKRDSLLGNVEFAFIDSGPPFNENKGAGTNIKEVGVDVHQVRWNDYCKVREYMTFRGLIIVHDMEMACWPGAKEMLEEGVYVGLNKAITIQQLRRLGS